MVGTNGIGTALATRRPAQVHAAEHFCEGIKRWTCAGAPVYEPGTDAKSWAWWISPDRRTPISATTWHWPSPPHGRSRRCWASGPRASACGCWKCVCSACLLPTRPG